MHRLDSKQENNEQESNKIIKSQSGFGEPLITLGLNSNCNLKLMTGVQSQLFL